MLGNNFNLFLVDFGPFGTFLGLFNYLDFLFLKLSEMVFFASSTSPWILLSVSGGNCVDTK
jgi:hypothetical protein